MKRRNAKIEAKRKELEQKVSSLTIQWEAEDELCGYVNQDRVKFLCEQIKMCYDKE